MKVRAVIFDVYGTLLEVGLPPADAEQRYRDLFETALHRPPVLSRLEFASASTRAIAKLHETARRRGIPHPEIIWESVVESVLPEVAGLARPSRDAFILELVSTGHSVRLMPGCGRVLLELEQRGFPLGIASNAQAYTLRELDDCLSECGAGLELFDPELCFWSYAHGFSKPDPHTFQILAARLERRGIPAQEILMVGDRMDNDILPARQHGWQTWFLSPHDPAVNQPGGTWEELGRRLAEMSGVTV